MSSREGLRVVGGDLTRGDSALVRSVRSLPGAGALLEWAPVRHAASARRLGSLVTETSRFAGAELLGLGGVRRYHLRESGRSVLVRHGTVDIWTFGEVFDLRVYEPPPELAARLERMASPLVVDLGANVGMFGASVLARWPGARIVAYEPDPRSAAIHRRLMALDDADGRWELVEACAGTRDGTAAFMPGQETLSHVVGDATPGAVAMPMADVLPLMARADLVKLDIEGGEWALLADPRFAATRALVLEYHPEGCPTDQPTAAARDLLVAHGLEVMPLFEAPDGGGMLWAVRT